MAVQSKPKRRNVLWEAIGAAQRETLIEYSRAIDLAEAALAFNEAACEVAKFLVLGKMTGRPPFLLRRNLTRAYYLKLKKGGEGWL